MGQTLITEIGWNAEATVSPEDSASDLIVDAWTWLFATED